MVFFQSGPQPVTGRRDPVDVPGPAAGFGPVTNIDVVVSTTKSGVPQPAPSTVEVSVKGCLEGK